MSKAEQNHLIKVGWKNENIAWYGSKRDPAPTVNKQELQVLYDKVKNTSKGTYTDTSWQPFQRALSNAKSVLDNGKATQEQVNTAKERLQAAFNGLEKAPEVNAFSATAGDNGSITGTANGDYTEGTQISVTATPDPGYMFKEWTTTTGLPASTDTDSATISFDMPANAVTLEAEFVQVYQINDYYPDPNDSTTAIGKVFEISEGGLHGKVVNTVRSQNHLSWGPNTVGTEATNETDGLSNMAVITSQPDWKNTYPLFAWVDEKNAAGTTYSSGQKGIWYIPAIQELQAITRIITFAEPTWSSTENSSNTTQAWSVSQSPHNLEEKDKGEQHPTYAVLKF